MALGRVFLLLVLPGSYSTVLSVLKGGRRRTGGEEGKPRMGAVVSGLCLTGKGRKGWGWDAGGLPSGQAPRVLALVLIPFP